VQEKGYPICNKKKDSNNHTLLPFARARAVHPTAGAFIPPTIGPYIISTVNNAERRIKTKFDVHKS
jgi:hypothetical protein